MTTPRAKRGFQVTPPPAPNGAGAPPAPAPDRAGTPSQEHDNSQALDNQGLSVLPDIASMLASNSANGQGGGASIPVGALINGRPDPERDRVQLNVRQRRDIVQTLDLVARLTKRTREALVQDALAAMMAERYPDQLTEVHRALYGQ